MSNLFQATKRESAVDIVVNSIKQLLMDKKLLPGDKLPNELEISEGLGVSRGSVREAMKILSAFGLVDIRVGNGTYVSESPDSNLLDSLLFTYFVTNPDVNNLYEFRQIFETDIVELVIDHFDENGAQRKALKKNLDELEALIRANADTDTIFKKDMEFHHILLLILSALPFPIHTHIKRANLLTRHIQKFTISSRKNVTIKLKTALKIP